MTIFFGADVVDWSNSFSTSRRRDYCEQKQDSDDKPLAGPRRRDMTVDRGNNRAHEPGTMIAMFDKSCSATSQVEV